jgi:hypothetical protein
MNKFLAPSNLFLKKYHPMRMSLMGNFYFSTKKANFLENHLEGFVEQIAGGEAFLFEKEELAASIAAR